MGRHARGASRSRVPLTALVLLAATAAIVGAGSWLGTGPSLPIGESEPTSAVVVTSLACVDGAGGTVVDVLVLHGAPVRAQLDACGYQEGQQLQVQVLPDDPTQVVLAGNESATDFFTGDRLPFAWGIAALLAIAAVLAILVDGRRADGRASGRRSGRWAGWLRQGGPGNRGAGSRHVAAHELRDADESADVDEYVEAVVGSGPVAGQPALVGASRFADREWNLSTVDLNFPFSSSLAECLHDELFTHRSQPG